MCELRHVTELHHAAEPRHATVPRHVSATSRDRGAYVEEAWQLAHDGVDGGQSRLVAVAAARVRHVPVTRQTLGSTVYIHVTVGRCPEPTEAFSSYASFRNHEQYPSSIRATVSS